MRSSCKHHTIEKGTTLGVVGESGCGKSTLGRVILRLIPATSGEVLYNGENILKLGKKDMARMTQKMQIVFQDPYASLNPRMSVSDIIADPIRVHKLIPNDEECQARVSELMETVGLAKRLTNAYPHELDGGRRQRIGIARALSVSPEFIVCDEPVSSLDVSIQAQILNLLMDLQEERKLTYMFITHDLSVVKHISNEIIVMYMGQCVERAKTQDLFADPQHPYTKALLSSVPIPSVRPEHKMQNIIKGEVASPVNMPNPYNRSPAFCGEGCGLSEIYPPSPRKGARGWGASTLHQRCVKPVGAHTQVLLPLVSTLFCA